MRSRASGFGGRAFTRVIATMVMLGFGWLAGLTFRSGGGVRRTPVVWPADAATGLELVPIAGRPPGRHAGSAPALHIFGDYECGACLSMHRRMGPRLVELARSGRLRVFYHMAPLAPHWRGALAGRIAYCVPLSRRVAAHERIFAAVAEWVVAADAETAILGAVAGAGVDTSDLRQCVGSGAGKTAVQRDRSLAAGLGVHAVPAIFLNDRRIQFDSWRSLERFVERAASP